MVTIARTPSTTASISVEAIEKMNESRAWVEHVQKTGKPVVYGVNTGFGSKAGISINKENLLELQQNLIMSHSAGTGEPFPVDVVRAAMLLRANTLVRGYSGIRPEVVKTLLLMLERNVIPWIPSQGSVGASGDLAPLAHLALVLNKVDSNEPERDGKAYFYNSEKKSWILMSGKDAMNKAKIPTIKLEAKEGLALTNGTQISTALLSLALHDAVELTKIADISMAMSFEALLGISSAFRPEIHKLRPHSGQIKTAENILILTQGSQLLDSDPEKVQDAYSLRCHPQVLGAVRDNLQHIHNILDIEMNSTNDNPIILTELQDENKAVAGGNFHAQPIAFASDLLSIVLCEIGSIAERRVFRLSDSNLNEGLPSFLILNSGLESGLMIAQYTAASIVSENKSLAHPASIDSIPTCENQEDHVSMAPIAARKAQQILENIYKILAIELLFAAQALDLRIRLSKIEKPAQFIGKGTYEAYHTVRQSVKYREKDRPIYPDIEQIINLIKSSELILRVEEKVGKLN
jgi:histidine ammonia-lyase